MPMNGAASGSTVPDTGEATAQKFRGFRVTQLFVACGLLLVAAITVGIAFILSDLRSRTLADNERQLANLVSVLAEQTDRAVQAVELIQSGLIERFQALGIASAEDFEQQTAAGQSQEAEQSYQRAVQLLNRLVEEFPESAIRRADLAETLAGLADPRPWPTARGGRNPPSRDLPL